MQIAVEKVAKVEADERSAFPLAPSLINNDGRKKISVTLCRIYVIV